MIQFFVFVAMVFLFLFAAGLLIGAGCLASDGDWACVPFFLAAAVLSLCVYAVGTSNAIATGEAKVELRDQKDGSRAWEIIYPEGK